MRALMQCLVSSGVSVKPCRQMHVSGSMRSGFITLTATHAAFALALAFGFAAGAFAAGFAAAFVDGTSAATAIFFASLVGFSK